MAVNPLTKIALVTGANTGMGYQTALALASRSFKVIMADKDDQTESSRKLIQASFNDNIVTKHLNLASFNSIRSFVDQLTSEEQRLDVLVNNAGVFCMKNRATCDGLDGVMQVNHFGPFLLTNLLVELLGKSEYGGRIIFVTSSGAFFHDLTLKSLLEPKVFTPNLLSTALNYYNSKLCNMIASKGFAERLKQCSNITSNCLHPGMTNTSFLVKTGTEENCFETVAKRITKTALRYSTSEASNSAGLAVFLAASNSMRGTSGEYFVNYRAHRQPSVLDNAEFCNRIWSESEKLVGLNKIR
ncbi:hypothetical protein NQ315_001540 [Exocentrus adspersus]|uniref:Uncharacterized protein n=1 Tax=Exocentrus adspersus TaxID=1586481 RepID=A0AAV8W9J2_9CUCU|nr:hypothetical protein NQ315_001540 [Exocentrus adspersus]